MEHTRNRNIKETTRVEAFSDGVFAIAITLLVLELITTLHPENGIGIVQTCLDHWRSFLAFTIGFITILVCWINHHTAFEYIKKIDTRFLWINGFLLFVVTLTPFPTAILAEYLEKEPTTALAIFGFNYILIAIAANAICTHVYNHHLLEKEDKEYYYSFKLLYRYAIVYNLIAFCLCFVSVIVPICMYALLFAFFAAPKEVASMMHKRRMARKRR